MDVGPVFGCASGLGDWIRGVQPARLALSEQAKQSSVCEPGLRMPGSTCWLRFVPLRASSGQVVGAGVGRLIILLESQA